MTYIFEEETTMESVENGLFHHNRKRQGDYIAITDTKVLFETAENHPNVGGIRKVVQFREEYMVEKGTGDERLVNTNCYDIDANTPDRPLNPNHKPTQKGSKK